MYHCMSSPCEIHYGISSAFANFTSQSCTIYISAHITYHRVLGDTRALLTAVREAMEKALRAAENMLEVVLSVGRVFQLCGLRAFSPGRHPSQTNSNREN